MTEDNFKRANRLYNNIRDAQQNLKDIKWYEHKLFKKNIPIVVDVPYTVGTYAVDSHIVIFDVAVINDILNTIKIHSIQTIQNAEKELGEL